MKKIILCCLFSLIISLPAGVFAVEKNFDGKIGGGYAFDPEHLGLNVEGTYLWVFDPYFAAGLQSGLFWINWEETRSKGNIGSTPVDVKARTNAFQIPALAVAQLRLPNIKESIGILPYLSVGLGASAMYVGYSDPAYTDESGYHKKQNEKKLFGGFTWEAIVGAAYSPAGSKVSFLFETGYVGSDLSHGNKDIDMSRLIANIGVRIPFGN